MNNVFAYWAGSDQTPLAPFAADWQKSFSEFKIFGDRDVEPILDAHSPRHVDLYRAIRLPAARSDVARLLLLHEYGGLYVDCHVGVRSRQGILDNFHRLEDGLELIVIDRARSIAARPADEYYFLNSVIFARPGCSLVLICVYQALANLECHRTLERKLGFVPYHVATLSGPGVVNSTLLDPRSVARSLRTKLRPDYKEKIGVIPEEIAPITRRVHSSYRIPGQHWSERQVVEKLFEPE